MRAWRFGIILVSVMWLCSFVSAAPVNADASVVEASEISVCINGKEIPLSEVPLIHNGSAMLPLREVLIALGVKDDDEHIYWDSADQSVHIIKDSTTIVMKPDDPVAFVDGERIDLDATALLYKKSGRMYVPVRFVARILGNEVAWDKYLKRVYISDKVRYREVKRLLDDSLTKMRELNKYAMFNYDSCMNSLLGQEGFRGIVIDRTNRRSRTAYFNDMNSSYITEELCCQDGVRYHWDFEEREWIRWVDSEVKFDYQIENTYPDEIINARDVVYAGLSVTSDATGEYYILSGPILPLYRSLEQMGGYNSPILTYSDGRVVIKISKKTGYIECIDTVEVSKDSIREYSIERTVWYGDFNNIGEIAIPSNVSDGD